MCVLPTKIGLKYQAVKVLFLVSDFSSCQQLCSPFQQFVGVILACCLARNINRAKYEQV